MEAVAAWAQRELKNMEQANRLVGDWLGEARSQALLPLLQQTLEEQHAVNVHHQERIQRLLTVVEGPSEPPPRAAAEALVADARSGVAAAETPVARDLVIAQHALRIEHWEVGAWRGLGRVFRLLLVDDVADEIAALLRELTTAERHLASLGLRATDDDDESYQHRTPARRPYRSPLHQGPHED